MDFPLILPDRSPMASGWQVSRNYNFRGMRSSFMVELEHFDFSKCHIEDAAELCMNAEIARQASEACNLARKRGGDCPPTEEAVYIVAPKGRAACKVGIARDPANRIAGLQTSNWEDLEICGLFWCIKEGTASKLESATHRAAKGFGLHARGEWFNTSPEMMGIVVMAAAKGLGIRVADSTMFLRGREAIRWQLRYLDDNQEPSWLAARSAAKAA